MKPARFDYARPDSLADTLGLLARHGADAALLAGGQSLVPMLNLRMARPAMLIDINRVPGLDAIRLTDGVLSIGARTRHAAALGSPVVREAAPLLTQALTQVAHPAIRNRGTLGGSLALADPAAELPACMVALEAAIIVASVRGERRIPASEFFQGVYATALAPDEVLLRVELAAAAAGWRFAFREVARRHGDFAMAGLALAAEVRGGSIANCRIAFCGVEAAPRRQPAAEAALIGSGADAACHVLAPELEAMAGTDIPAEYRIHLARTLLRRAAAAIIVEEATTHG